MIMLAAGEVRTPGVANFGGMVKGVNCKADAEAVEWRGHYS